MKKLLKNSNVQLIIAIAIFILISFLFIDYTIDYHTKKSYPPPWAGLDCNEMLDFSASEEHIVMNMDMHIEFHTDFLENCSDMKMDLDP